jgi:hypothetical protein
MVVYAVITKQTEMFVLYIAQYTYCPNKGRGRSVKFCTILASFLYLTSFFQVLVYVFKTTATGRKPNCS